MMDRDSRGSQEDPFGGILRVTADFASLEPYRTALFTSSRSEGRHDDDARQNPALIPYATGEWKDAVLHARIAIGVLNLLGPASRKCIQYEVRI